MHRLDIQDVLRTSVLHLSTYVGVRKMKKKEGKEKREREREQERPCSLEKKATDAVSWALLTSGQLRRHTSTGREVRNACFFFSSGRALCLRPSIGEWKKEPYLFEGWGASGSKDCTKHLLRRADAGRRGPTTLFRQQQQQQQQLVNSPGPGSFVPSCALSLSLSSFRLVSLFLSHSPFLGSGCHFNFDNVFPSNQPHTYSHIGLSFLSLFQYSVLS